MSVVHGEVKLEYWHSINKTARFRENATLEIVRDEKNVYWIAIGPKVSRKTSFKIRKNLQKIYSQEVAQGKATIELLVPHVLLYVRRADPDELTPFLRNVTEIFLDDDFEIEDLARPRAPQALEGRRRRAQANGDEEHHAQHEPDEYEPESADDSHVDAPQEEPAPSAEEREENVTEKEDVKANEDVTAVEKEAEKEIGERRESAATDS